MDERLSLRSLPHINTHAQSFFSPAEPTIEIRPKTEHDKNPKLARRNFYLREGSHFVCNGSSVKGVEFELSVY